jgi:cell wall-associated NlpC family hydrolase
MRDVPQHVTEGFPLAVAFAVVRRPVLIVAILVSLMLVSTTPVAAQTEAGHVIGIARNQLGEPWVWATRGPDRFDCIGLVHYSFKKAALLDRIGGRYRSIRGYKDWFANRGLASRSNGKPGDLVIWGRFQHIGIYLGDGKAISTLTSGVAIHSVFKISVPFRTFLHVKLAR